VNRSTAGGAVVTTAAFVVAVVTDATLPSVNAWWNRHALLGSFVASVLILGITVQVVDQVTARRRVKDRERVAAVQALIVFGQAQRTVNVLLGPVDERRTGDPAGEAQALASMILTASPALFEDPTARAFMEDVERFTTLLLRTMRHSRGHDGTSDADRAKVKEANDKLKLAVQPLLTRLDRRVVAALEDEDTPA
jgi:hypothetical protein